jgi:hypothetical protein
MKRLAFVLLLASCYDWNALSSVPDFSGNYVVVMTNGDDGCKIGNNGTGWMVGMMSDGIPLDVTQSSNQVVATVGGISGTALNLFCGTNQLVGTVSQGAMDVSIQCPKESRQNTCVFHYLAHAHATLSGNHITGTIDYTTIITTMTADCLAPQPLPNCKSTQTFTGNRG